MESFPIQFLRGFDSMEWLTVGLVVFAGVQVLVAVRHEQQRRRERASEERARRAELDRLADQDVLIVLAEHFRLDVLAKEWRQLDLVELSLMGVFEPAQLLSDQSSQVLVALSRSSVEAGQLGAIALSQGHEASRGAARLARMLKNLSEKHPDRSPAELAALARTIPGLLESEEAVKRGAEESALALWDALSHVPRATVKREPVFRHGLTSQVARRAVAAIERQSLVNAKVLSSQTDAV